MRRPEQSLQRSLVQLMELSLPRGWIIHHSANRPRSKVAGAIEKSMGAKAGYPDIVVHGQNELGHPRTYFLEVKAPKGRLSERQHAVLDGLTDLGFPTAVVRSPEDVQALARKWQWPWRAIAFTAILSLAVGGP